MWECVLETSGAAPLSAAGPLRWVRSVEGYRLVGSHVPAQEPAKRAGNPGLAAAAQDLGLGTASGQCTSRAGAAVHHGGRSPARRTPMPRMMFVWRWNIALPDTLLNAPLAS